MKQLILNHRFSLLVSILFVFIISCGSIRLISEYDEITDKTVSSLQQKMSKFFVEMENEVGMEKTKYDNYKNFYQDATVDLNTLKIRADAIDKNQIVQEQLVELKKMITNLEELHKMGFTNIDQIKVFKQPFNSAFTAIIKLQLGLKRGETTSK